MSTDKQHHAQVLNEQIVQGLKNTGRQIALAIEDARHTCIVCLNFDEATETCRLANARPPARIIALGCPSWDGCPF